MVIIVSCNLITKLDIKEINSFEEPQTTTNEETHNHREIMTNYIIK